jgi:L,D-peptidoglycan transpeptidase YkuD (ErfK/YbiS/YcfS/YnhG family)
MSPRSRLSLVSAVLAMVLGESAREETVSRADERCRQLLLVVVPDWSATRGTVARYQREAGAWAPVGAPVPATIGRAGCGWGAGLHPPIAAEPRKLEGDGRSPAGMFGIGLAFGADETLETGLAYRQMTAHDWCIDVADSPHYNRIVDDRAVGPEAIRGSTEPMRRDLHLDGDRLYAVGFVIGHNTACDAGGGSCIFAHPWKDATTPTAGCTAMSEEDLREVLRWLRAEAAPRFVLLPAAEHRRLWRAWDIPPPGDAP